MTVVIFELEDQTEGIAEVKRVNDKTGLVYLAVAWESLHDTDQVRVDVRDSVGVSSRSTSPRPTFQLVRC